MTYTLVHRTYTNTNIRQLLISAWSYDYDFCSDCVLANEPLVKLNMIFLLIGLRTLCGNVGAYGRRGAPVAVCNSLSAEKFPNYFLEHVE